MQLAASGIGVGWLRAWLLAAGADKVDVHALQNASSSWDEEGWQLFIADERDLMRVALAHGKRLGIREDGQRDVLASERIELENPPRSAWFYTRAGRGKVLLLPLGDVAYQRDLWLHPFLEDRRPLPLLVWMGDEGGIDLEPGLRGEVGVRKERGPNEVAFNDGGFLPEEQILQVFGRYGLRIRLAESCTGGWITERITRIPGASEVLDRAWVCYSNRSKTEMLGVPESLINAHGAVSKEVVEAMAAGACATGCVSLAVSGIAGPSGGTLAKPVGTVWMAAKKQEQPAVARCFSFQGSRSAIRARSVIAACHLLLEVAEG